MYDGTSQLPLPEISGILASGIPVSANCTKTSLYVDFSPLDGIRITSDHPISPSGEHDCDQYSMAIGVWPPADRVYRDPTLVSTNCPTVARPGLRVKITKRAYIGMDKRDRFEVA
jgi:hypothetical protein